MITKTKKILKGIQIKWTKIYTLMHRIQMKLESFLNQIFQSKNTSTKIKIASRVKP